MSSARLLALGAALYDAHPALRAEARACVRPGFAPAMRWMALALRTIRSEPLRASPDPARHASVPSLKYALAVCSGLATLLAARSLRAPFTLALPAAALGFYAAEVQFVFSVPLALDGDPRPLRSSAALVARTGGTLAALTRVLPIAAHMVAGLASRDPLRAWCAGCAAVLYWYDEARAPYPLTESPCAP